MDHIIWLIIIWTIRFGSYDMGFWNKLVEQIIAKQVREMSRFLETDLDEDTIQKIAKHCTFDNLKNVKTFDLSARMKAMNNCLPFKIMRVSHH